MVQLSNMLIGLFIVGLITTGVALVVVNVTDSYGVNFNDSNMNSIKNKVNELNTYTNETRDKIYGLDTNDNILDLLGAFFSGGYDALKSIIKSFDIFGSVTSTSIDSVSGLVADDQGIFSNALKNALLGILIVVVFITIVMAVLLKSERI